MYLNKFIMRFTLFFNLCYIGLSLATANNALSQGKDEARINLSVTDVTVSSIFEVLSKQTGCKFFYDELYMSQMKSVTIHLENVSLQQVLGQLSANTGLGFWKVDNTYAVVPPHGEIISGSKVLQGLTITGIVTDESGAPMPGVNIVVQGTTSGVVTDVDGKYSINIANKEVVVVFSFVGFETQEHAIGNQTTINVVMIEDTREIEEIVVVGYGTQKKMDLTGSIQSVNQKVIESMPVSSIDQKIVGQVAGVQIQQVSGAPGSGTSVKIRGSGSLGAGNEPLYVVDGMPYSSTLNRDVNPLLYINSNDIESITVLKDASSTAIYGSRGANGVIMITTKKGNYDQTNVNFSAMVGVQQVPQKGRPQMMNQQEFAEFQREKIDIIVNQRENREATLDDYPEAYRYPEKLTSKGTDWYDLVLQDALIQDYNLNVQKGTKESRINFSLGYYNQEGVLKTTGLERYSAKLSMDSEIGKFIKIGAIIQPAFISQKRAETSVDRTDVLGIATWANPLMSPYDEQGRLIPYIISPQSKYHSAWNFVNPLYLLEQINQSQKNFQNLGIAYIEWEIIKGLKAKSSINTIWSTSSYNQYTPGTVGGANDPPSGNGKSYNDRGNTFNWLTENTLTYSKQIKKHGFNLLLGFTAQKSVSNSINLEANPYSNDLIETINAAQAIRAWGEGVNEWSMISYLGRINYNFNQKYLLTATFRSDGSSRFGPKNRFAFFPSIAGAWRISEEDFLKNHTVINNIKLRLSYGKSGNNNIGNYAHVAAINSGEYIFGDKLVSANSLGQSNFYLGWEESSQIDAGIDVGILKNRISLVVDYYYRKSNNMLLNNTIPAITGFNSQIVNDGNIRNTGVEVALGLVPVTGSFVWDMNINMSINRNKVISLNESTKSIAAGNNDNLPTHITLPGKPIGMFYGFVHDGLYTAENMTNPDIKKTLQVYEGNAKYRDIDGDGIISDLLDYDIIGNPHPDFIYGITNSFFYKNIDLSIVINGQYGGDVVNGLRQTVDNQMGFFNVSNEWVNRWKSSENPGDGIHYGIPKVAPTWGHRFSDFWIEDASYLRITNLTLGYTLPSSKINFIKNCRVYCTVQNLATFTKYKGANPEGQKATVSNTLASGFDLTSYPLSRTFSAGINVTF